MKDSDLSPNQAKFKLYLDREYYPKFCSQRSMQVLYGLIMIFLTLTIYNLRYTANFELMQVGIDSKVVRLEEKASEGKEQLKSIKEQLDTLTSILITKLASDTGG